MNQLSKIDFKELDQMTSEIAEKFFLAKQIKDSDNTELINAKVSRSNLWLIRFLF